jgi:myo-inositol-1(or 4)-monophosphatase
MDYVTLGKQCIAAALKKLSEIREIIITEDTLNVQTNADLESNKAILDCIKKSGLTCNVFSEEEKDMLKINGGNDDVIIMLDPIDNTHLYLRGEISFCSVALMIIIKGTPKYAFVSDITTNDIYYCDENKSYKNDEVITVPQKVPGRNIILGYAPYKMRMERLVSSLIDLTEEEYYLYNFGGQLQTVKIATGNYDAYVEIRAETLNEFCGAVIVQRAGGIVTTIQGKNVDYSPNKKQTLLVARNKKIHTDILNLLKDKEYEN